MFEAGDKVRWVRAVNEPENKNASRSVIAVVPSDCSAEQFNMYEVEFEFGRFTLYGTQIELE